VQRFDLLVGADGARSFVRQQMLPEVKPRYAGYVAWRGVVPESEADHFTFQQMRHSHILCYVIPGAAGERERGKRRLNWVWYWNVPESELSALMTGRDGRLHDFSVPPGQVSAQFLARQNAVADELLAPPFRALWRATRDPFLQPILDLAVPRMVFDRDAGTRCAGPLPNRPSIIMHCLEAVEADHDKPDCVHFGPGRFNHADVESLFRGAPRGDLLRS